MINKLSWTHLCPQTKKTTHQIRHLASQRKKRIVKRHLATYNKCLSATARKRTGKLRISTENKLKTAKAQRHLALKNKRLSAPAGKRAGKLRASPEIKLRKRQTKALSKKVNKDVSGIEIPQSKSVTPRAKNTKVPKNKNQRNKQGKNRISTRSPRHNSVLHQPNKEQVNYLLKSTSPMSHLSSALIDLF